MPDRIDTERLLLRPIMLEDAEDLHAFFSDPLAMRYFGNLHHRFDETEKWVHRTLRSPRNSCREYALVIHGTVIGKAGIWDAPELGFFLRRDQWGKGLMSEALSALVPHLFAQMEITEMRADVDPDNAASLHLLKKHGFRETHRVRSTLCIDGLWCDSVYLNLPCPTAAQL
ncbi:MAG: GNAT family N-acetyltransferase [Pseudomonadota bacterium]